MMDEIKTPAVIGNRLRNLRKTNDMTQQEVADALGVKREMQAI